MEWLVVGSGTAGAVVASRLTEHAGHAVTLLEAGPDYPELASLPYDLGDGTRNSMTTHDWGLWHRPNLASQLRLPYPRGRVVGGSSAVNTCIAVRGQPEDYDEWGALGLDEWTWDQCLPAFRRLERDVDFSERDGHGAAGPMPIRRHPPGEMMAWQASFLEAARERGHAPVADHNAVHQLGAGPTPMNKIGGRRISAAEAYLPPPTRARSNFRLRPDTLVRRVLVRDGRAWGVEVEHAGAVHVLRSNRIVLAAGAVATPGILLRSGVGPARELARLGVDVVVDLPAVGARLLDHAGCALFYAHRAGGRFTARDTPELRLPLMQAMLRMTSPGSEVPGDLQLQAGTRVPIPVPPLRNWVGLMVQVGKMRGHGSLHFASAHPKQKPRITSALLHHPDDAAKALFAVRELLALGATKSLSGDATLAWPMPADRTGDALLRWLRRWNDSGYHPCGTVPMGREGDPNAALDGRGRVRGVRGLWVVDASAMPALPSANTNVPTLMMGERFAAWLAAGDAEP